jgi:hypothetical protein
MVTSPKGLGPDKNYAGEGQSIYRRQTRPLVREGAHKNKTVTVKDGARHQDFLID